MFRRYRHYEPGEFIVVGVDTAWGGTDYCTAQFLSNTQLDVPTVFHSKILATEMTPQIHNELERIHDVTKVKPTVAFERNNGGVAELERLATLNRNGKYNIYVEKHGVGTTEATEETVKLGWTTSSASRPTMLSMLKEAIDQRLIRIYDKPTINEMFAFIISQTSSSWKAQAEVGAHDDCFVKNTMILTDKGEIPIQDIRVGHMVLTRAGYKPVTNTRSKRKRVISRLGLVGTPDHPVISDKSEIPLQSTKATDIIYIWNEKQSSIERRSITDTLIQHGVTTEFITGDTTNGKNHQLPSTDKSIWTNTVEYPKGISFTTLTTTPSTTNRLTSKQSVGANTPNTICELKNVENSVVEQPKLKETGSKIRLVNGKQTTQRKLKKSIQRTEENKPKEQQKYYRTGEITTLKRLKRLLVLMGLKLQPKRRVYNLQVAEQPEYFANGILVHNCIMALAIAWQLFQSERPPSIKVRRQTRTQKRSSFHVT